MNRQPRVPARQAPRPHRALPALIALLALTLVAACGGAEPARVAPHAAVPIPAPTGSFGVGSILLDVEDSRPAEERPEGLARTIEAQVWYPAPRERPGTRMPYFPRPVVLDRMLARGYFSQPQIRLMEWSRMEVQALRNALPVVQPGGFPLLLFAPGAGIPAEQYAALLQELVSRGFVIVAVSPRATELPSIRRTSGSARAEDPDQRAADLSLVLRRFVSATGSVAAIAQRADLTRAGAFGHAAGGLVALRACALEAVLRRCASLDGSPADIDRQRALTRPFVVIASQPDSATAQATVTGVPDDAPARWVALLDRADSAPGAVLRLEGASTMTFTDAPFVMPAIAGALGQRGEPAVLQRAAADALAAFFAERDAASLAALDAVDAARPELSRLR